MESEDTGNLQTKKCHDLTYFEVTLAALEKIDCQRQSESGDTGQDAFTVLWETVGGGQLTGHGCDDRETFTGTNPRALSGSPNSLVGYPPGIPLSFPFLILITICTFSSEM